MREIWSVNDVKARWEAVALSQAKRLAANLRVLGDATAKLAAVGSAEAMRGARYCLAEAEKLRSTQLSPFARTLAAAGAAGAIAAIGVVSAAHLLDNSDARLDENIATLSKRVDSIERTTNEAFTTSHAALSTLGNRVAAAESAISKSTALTNSTLAEIQKAVSGQIQPRAPTPGAAAEAADLGRLEMRVAALEEKASPHAQLGEGVGEPADIDHGPSAFPPFDANNFAPLLIWLALTFGLLYLLMSKIALPRVENILHSRAGKITKDISEAQAFRAQSEQAAAAHDKTIADARAKALALAQQTQAKLAAEADAKRHALEADLNSKLAGAEAKIGETKAKAMANVEEIARDAAAAIVQHITGKPADPKAIAAAIAAKS
jgi:F-type H+-transporting ATPase subunit b